MRNRLQTKYRDLTNIFLLIGILQFLLILIAWTILVMVLRYAKGNSNFVHKLIDGDPTLVIDHGKILTDACMRVGLMPAIFI